LATDNGKVPERDEGHENRRGIPDSVEKDLKAKNEDTKSVLCGRIDDLDEVVPPLVFQFLPTNFMDARLKAAFPSHEFYHPNSSKDLVHQRDPLIPCFHEVVLGVYDDLSGEVVQWKEQTCDE
jgi:hypothetical protein